MRFYRSLMNNYTNNEHEPGNPILYHGVYSWHSGKGVDEGNIWGDYYYMEAIDASIKRMGILLVIRKRGDKK